ncbi:MAG: glycosyltransferase family 2 protein [Coriobacteriia bacterium]|nr:glycosyltransferase family 2 protein [Coriobacteriia bacterium]MBN2822707.1 glycosyltransferase family 2 protein [Coriobacteriia bacterium]
MTKLIIQIPCYNEEETLPVTLADLPREVEGIDVVEWLIIDDGSTDRTAEVARERGVDHVVSMTRNSGLARVYMAGLDACLRRGADIIVNTDADNQYQAADIPLLVRPVLEGRADIVVGARPVADIPHFSPIKKFLQKLGSWAVRVASNTDIPDAPSGFRAISRRAAMRLNVHSDYTYTLETIIQAGRLGIPIESVPIRVNGDLRPSRLVKSIWAYVRRSIVTIVRIFATYKPTTFFVVPGLTSILLGTITGLRFVVFYLLGQGGGHVQSLVLTAILMVVGFQLIMFGGLAELQAVNRKLLEDIQWRTRKMDIETDGRWDTDRA